MATSPTNIVKRSAIIGGHKTSLSLENEFWFSLKAIAASRAKTLSDLLTEIDGRRGEANLSSAVRLYVLAHFQALAMRHEIGSSPLPH